MCSPSELGAEFFVSFRPILTQHLDRPIVVELGAFFPFLRHAPPALGCDPNAG